MIDDHGRNRLPGDGYTLHACNLRPRSRGRITLTGDRATDKPRIEANYLGDPEGFDLKVMVACARISLDILAQKAFADYQLGRAPCRERVWQYGSISVVAVVFTKKRAKR